MLKRILISTLLVIFFIAASFNSSDAFFFKKKKTSGSEASSTSQENENNKVLLVEIYASWCPGCKNIQPALDQIQKDLPDIKLVQLDVSTPSKAEASQKIAKELGIQDFFKANKSKTALVAVIAPVSREIISVFNNENDVDEYASAIQEARTKGLELQQPHT